MRGTAAARALRWWAAAGLAILAGLAVALRGATRSWFQYDDFFNFGLAQRDGLTWDYLREPFFEHFEPGHRALTWALQRWFTLDWTAALAIQAAFLAGGALCLFGVLRLVSRPSPWHLVLVFTYVAALGNVSSLAWWSAGAQILTSAAGTLACVLLVVVHVRTRSSWSLLGVAIAFAAALSFYEKPILLPFYLALLLVLIVEPPGGARAAVRALLREWRVWTILGVLAVAYLVFYRSAGYGASQPLAPIGELWSYAKITWLRGFAPSLIGTVTDEPATRWQEVSIVAAQAIVLILVAWTVARRPTVALRAWAFFAIAFLVNLAIVGASRVDQFGSGIGLEARYWTEYNVVFAIAAGLALSGRVDGAGERSLGRLPQWALRPAVPWVWRSSPQPSSRLAPGMRSRSCGRWAPRSSSRRSWSDFGTTCRSCAVRASLRSSRTNPCPLMRFRARGLRRTTAGGTSLPCSASGCRWPRLPCASTPWR